MNVKNRIKKFIDSENLTVSAFEKSINASNGYVNSISRSVGLEKIEKIADIYPELSLEWLLTGKGGMIKKEMEEVKEKNTEFKRLSIEDKLTALHQENKDLKDTLLRENRQFRKYIDDQVLESLDATHLLLEVILLKMGENIGKLKGENKKKAIEKLLQKL